jgi:hypothetical protein
MRSYKINRGSHPIDLIQSKTISDNITIAKTNVILTLTLTSSSTRATESRDSIRIRQLNIDFPCMHYEVGLYISFSYIKVF